MYAVWDNCMKYYHVSVSTVYVYVFIVCKMKGILYKCTKLNKGFRALTQGAK